MTDYRALRSRVPGQSAISEFLAAHRRVPPRSAVSRALGRSPLTAETRTRYRGVLGELMVGEALASLGQRWDVLHAVPLESGEPDIDHVVIGPAGVFTLTTRTHAGQDVAVVGDRLTVGGAPAPHIRAARFDAERASERLSAAARHPIEVTATLVIVDPHSLAIRERPLDVVVLHSRDLLEWFARADHALDGDAVARISDLVDRATTWSDAGDPGDDGEALTREFDAVRADVDDAIRRRVVWAVGGVLATYAALVVTVVTLVVSGASA